MMPTVIAGMLEALNLRVEPVHTGDGAPGLPAFDQRNPHHRTTAVNPRPVADNRALRFMAQLPLAGRHLLGFLRSPNSAELSGHCTDSSWFTPGWHPDNDGLHPLCAP